jgi:DeoR/GlpR family transcriptional regulator of sugar metabolism
LKARPAKSVRSIEKYLDTSERTIYRYLDLLKDLGFDIEKDGNNKIFIATSSDIDIIPFTLQEADYLKKLILSTGKKNQLAQSVLKKVQHSSEIQLGGDSLFKAHLSKIVEQISIAIVEGKQLLIKGYCSANSLSQSTSTSAQKRQLISFIRYWAPMLFNSFFWITCFGMLTISHILSNTSSPLPMI